MWQTIPQKTRSKGVGHVHEAALFGLHPRQGWSHASDFVAWIAFMPRVVTRFRLCCLDCIHAKGGRTPIQICSVAMIAFDCNQRKTGHVHLIMNFHCTKLTFGHGIVRSQLTNEWNCDWLKITSTIFGSFASVCNFCCCILLRYGPGHQIKSSLLYQVISSVCYSGAGNSCSLC